MTEKKPESVPTTKKLKSMLRMLTEFGVTRYKDSEVELEFAPPAPVVQPLQSFDFGRYDKETEEQSGASVIDEGRDDLGFTEEDYLFRSAQR